MTRLGMVRFVDHVLEEQESGFREELAADLDNCWDLLQAEADEHAASIDANLTSPAELDEAMRFWWRQRIAAFREEFLRYRLFAAEEEALNDRIADVEQARRIAEANACRAEMREKMAAHSAAQAIAECEDLRRELEGERRLRSEVQQKLTESEHANAELCQKAQVEQVRRELWGGPPPCRCGSLSLSVYCTCGIRLA